MTTQQKIVRFFSFQNDSDVGSQRTAIKSLWERLFILTLFSTYYYLLMEWLFFVTKPSFMDGLTTWEKFEILVNSSLVLIVAWLLPFLVLFGSGYLPLLSKQRNLLILIACFIPTAIFSLTTLILVDNFTYIIFQFGIISTQGVARIVYTFFFLIVFSLWFRWIIHRLKNSKQSNTKYPLPLSSIFVIGMIVVSAALTFPKMKLRNNLDAEGDIRTNVKLPHIILLGSDGVNAANTSLYGYERDTTPNLRDIADESLLAENAFANSGKTSGSIISIFNSKLPTKTRVIYPPDILRNADAYQHLPGILRRLGYHTIEISVSHYIDAYTLNLLDGFDIVNDRAEDQAGFGIFNRFAAFQSSGYFLSVLAERASDRLLDIFFVREMSNPYQEVTDVQLPTRDRSRVRKLINYLKEADQPLFIHVHLMGTHGEKFLPEQQFFSTGQTETTTWMTDFYDDAILEFDAYAGDVVGELSKLGLLDQTILVVYSDHGQKYDTGQRVPLMFRFPFGSHSGRIRSNTQNLDIAPTLLDYMGLPIPQWMEGQSLLAGEPDPLRPIFSSGASKASINESGYWNLDQERLEPPFFQFAYLQAVICQNRYLIDLIDYRWEKGIVTDHTALCEFASIPDEKSVQKLMLERLNSDGFVTSDLQGIFSTTQP